MMIKYIIVSVLTCLTAGFMVSCRQTEKTEAITAGIEAAQIEGRNAAKKLLNRTWNDSTEQQADLAGIDSIAATYTDTASSRQFRTTFESTLKTVRPDLFRKLKPEAE